MAHAHLAFPLAFGLPTILTWVVMFYLAGAIKDAHLRWVRWGSLLYGVGFYLQALPSLTPLGFLQYGYTLKYGYWYAKSLEPLPLDPGLRPFWQLALSQDLVWIRMLGDLVASLGFVIIGLLLLFTFKDAVRAR